MTCSPPVYFGIKPAGTSCGGGSGACDGGLNCVPIPPTASASHTPASPNFGDSVTVTGSGSTSSTYAMKSIDVYVDGSKVKTCTSFGTYRYCPYYYYTSGFWYCAGWYNKANYAGSCSISLSSPSVGSHSYYSVVTDSADRVATSATKSFTVVNPCNNNNICDETEVSATCGDCLESSEFSMTIDPTSGIANKGDVKDVNVSVLITGTGYAELSAENLPTGTTASFNPASCGGVDCYSNATITTTSSTPEGSSLITIKASSEDDKTSIYNLTVLTDNVSATCGDLTCGYPETQSSCSSDCSTTASIPSPVSPGESVTVTVEFYDFRYEANGNVKIDMIVNPEGTSWTPANGCFFGGKKMGSVASGSTIAWPPGTVSENGHFRISTTCTLPSSISAGSHTLVATPTIF